MKAIITVGVSASGKSTWAENHIANSHDRWMDINRDKIRFGMVDPGGNWSTYKFSKENERRVTEIQKTMIADCARADCNIIISDTNLNYDRTRALIEELNALGYHDVELMFFGITFEEACKRDALRANGVGYSVIARQMTQLIEFVRRFNDDEFGAWEECAPEDAPEAIIVDIDGTLAHMNGRGPFEWHRVGEDDIDHEVRDVVKAFHDMGAKILITSGRDNVCRVETTEWLVRHGVPFHALFMRERGSMEKDEIVKAEIYHRDIKPHYRVRLVIDDRPKVCRMWRNHGLKVMQVGNPYIEF